MVLHKVSERFVENDEQIARQPDIVIGSASLLLLTPEANAELYASCISSDDILTNRYRAGKFCQTYP